MSAGQCLLQPRQRVRSSTRDIEYCHGLNVSPVPFRGSVGTAQVLKQEHEGETYEETERYKHEASKISMPEPVDISG